MAVEARQGVPEEMSIPWAEGIFAGCSILVPPPRGWHHIPQELSLTGLSPPRWQELSPAQPFLPPLGAWHLSRGLCSLKLRACFAIVDPLLIMPEPFHVARYRQLKQCWAGLVSLCSPANPGCQWPRPWGGTGPPACKTGCGRPCRRCYLQVPPGSHQIREQRHWQQQI